ncbi:MAG: HD domain-containing protein [Desulfobacterales bacterium]|nr:HD domain-containing protein [Desulfobacterales bacterium]MBF0397081.1 HD domain-containing protein [Desulfobacterales bacterium]
MKVIINSIFSFWRPSVGRKMTLYFMLFGLIIFYVTSVIYGIHATHNFIKLTEKFINRQLVSMEYYNQQGDFISKNIGKRLPELYSLFNMLKYLPSDFNSITDFSIYCKDNKTDIWENIIIDENAFLKTEPVDDKEIIDKLNETLKKSNFHAHPYFYGTSQILTMLLNITANNDKNRYVLKIDGDIKGILGMIDKMLTIFTLFTIFILALSHFLGYLFSRKIANPIKLLAKGAATIAEGNFAYRFKVTEKNEIGYLAKSLNIMAESIEKHVSEIMRHMKMQETMNKIDKAVLSSRSRKQLLDHVIGIVSTLLNYNSIGIALRNEEKKGYDLISYYVGRRPGLISDTPFISDSEISLPGSYDTHNIFQMTSNIPEGLSHLIGKNVGSVINIPLFVTEKYKGSLMISRVEHCGFDMEEERTIKMLADQVGVALQNVQLSEEREKLFWGILIALSRTIDAKSNWTAGHSERVAAFVEKIGIEKGFTEERLVTLNISAILHDIGKIGVPEQILDKPSGLTEEEFVKISSHPQKGAEIIEDIPFYPEIKGGILHHHEKWDGSGYPANLKGYDIPEFAQIIAVADVFDAVTYDRPYRKGWSKEKAVAFLNEKKGVHFSPDIVDIFTKII